MAPFCPRPRCYPRGVPGTAFQLVGTCATGKIGLGWYVGRLRELFEMCPVGSYIFDKGVGIPPPQKPDLGVSVSNAGVIGGSADP